MRKYLATQMTLIKMTKILNLEEHTNRYRPPQQRLAPFAQLRSEPEAKFTMRDSQQRDDAQEMHHRWTFGLIFAQVCQSAEDYDRELGLCVCARPPGGSLCDGPCRRSPTTPVKLQCRTGGETELVYNNQARRGQKGIVFNCVVIFVSTHPLNQIGRVTLNVPNCSGRERL